MSKFTPLNVKRTTGGGGAMVGPGTFSGGALKLDTTLPDEVDKLKGQVERLDDIVAAQQERIDEFELDMSYMEERMNKLIERAKQLREAQHRSHPAWQPDDDILRIIEEL